MKFSKLIIVLVIVSFLLVVVRQSAYVDSIRQLSKPTSWSLSVGNRGFNVYLNEDGSPKLEEVTSTSKPFFQYFGMNAEGKYQAYSSFPELGVYIEKISKDKLDYIPNAYNAVWSPTDPNILAYTFYVEDAAGNTLEGKRIGIYNIKTKQSHIIENLITALPIMWDNSGSYLRVQEILSNMKYSPESSFLDEVYRSVNIYIDTKGEEFSRRQVTENTELATSGTPLLLLTEPLHITNKKKVTVDNTTIESITADVQNKIFNFSDGGKIEIVQDTFAHIVNVQQGIDTKVDLESYILGTSLPKGLIFIDSDKGAVRFINSMGEVKDIVLPKPVSVLATVTYYLPYSNSYTGWDMNVVQIGNGWTSVCNLFSHTGNLKYAYDVQSRQASNGPVVASADGTVTAIVKNVGCNALDTNGCADYRATCSSWGNYVLLKHADGKVTRYAHLQLNSPPSNLFVGAFVRRGCRIGSEGHTGNTAGVRNGCGDHLHYQWEDPNTGSSIKGSFVEFGTGSGNCGYIDSQNTGMSCVF